MLPRHAFVLCVFPALSTILLASDTKAPGAPAGSPASDAAIESGAPALFSWGDVNGDGRLDLAAVSADGKLQLLANVGDGRFEDVTDALGLAGINNASLALWADYDHDGQLDLFVGAREGASHLFHSAGGVFVDLSEGSGLKCEGAVQSAQWLDFDGDGRLDLLVVSEEKSELFHGLEGGFFEVSELPLGAVVNAGGLDTPSIPGSSIGRSGTRAGGPLGDKVGVDDVIVLGGPIVPGSPPRVGGGSSISSSPTPGIISTTPTGPFGPAPSSMFCASTLDDNATASCLSASSTPVLGKLYPLGNEFNIDALGRIGLGTTTPLHPVTLWDTPGAGFVQHYDNGGDPIEVGSYNGIGAGWYGTYSNHPLSFFVANGLASMTIDTNENVGIGTTTPAAKLEVAGTARITDTLTLSPSGDQALDVSTGSIYTGGTLFIHTKGGFANTALGIRALTSVTTGQRNTANGYVALWSNTTGSRNVASGYAALASNTTGSRNAASGYGALASNTTGVDNTAVGTDALSYNTTGSSNTASGLQALYHNTTGEYNTATGQRALYANTTGNRNIALGIYAGYNLTTGNDNIAIGNQGVAGEGATIRIGTSGTQTKAFIAAIRGVTTVNANAIPVLVDSAGQLGTVSSSRRFKKDIADMGDRTGRLLDLRPVVFHYKQDQTMPDGGEVPLEYGLIAEEVAEIFPDLVVYDEEGKPFTVKYHLMSAMLLNEMKKQAGELETQRSELVRLRGVEDRLAALESQVKSLAQAVATYGQSLGPSVRAACYAA